MLGEGGIEYKIFGLINGNLTKDLNQNIENIDYNFLNLPSQIEMADIAGISKNNFMQYHYLSDGQKLSQKVFTNGEVSTTRDYCGRFVYENGKLSYIIHADGVVRAVYNTPGGGSLPINPEMGITIMPADGGEVLSGFTREIHLKDHLGNVRAVFDYSKLQSENHYYPFGLPIHNLCTSTAPEGKENRYLYNGKELQDDLGLNWMDYGFRFYDATLSRWHVQDPKAEKYFSYSLYNYCINNPLNFIDPRGDTVLFAGDAEEAAYNAYKNYVNGKVNTYDKRTQALREKGKTKRADKRDKKRSDNAYVQIQGELDKAEKDETVFRVRMGKNISKSSGGGNICFNPNTNEIDVNILPIGDWTIMQKVAHEFKHVDQFINMELDISPNGVDGGLLYDYTDEIEAFERQNLFGPIVDAQKIVYENYSPLIRKGGPKSFHLFSPELQSQYKMSKYIYHGKD